MFGSWIGAKTACRAIDPQFRRVNLDVLGNTDAFVHAHIWPRYGWEPPALVTRPVWLYEPHRWRDPETALGPDHAHLRERITAELVALASDDTIRISGRRHRCHSRAPGRQGSPPSCC